MDPNQEEKKNMDSSKSDENNQNFDPFNNFMFGNRSSRQSNRRHTDNTQQNQNKDVDYSQLMKQFDEIMTSVNKIKPAIKQLSPLLDFFKKNK